MGLQSNRWLFDQSDWLKGRRRRSQSWRQIPTKADAGEMQLYAHGPQLCLDLLYIMLGKTSQGGAQGLVGLRCHILHQAAMLQEDWCSFQDTLSLQMGEQEHTEAPIQFCVG